MNRKRRKQADPVPAPPQEKSSPLISLVLAAVVLYVGWTKYGGTVGPGPNKPQPQPGGNPAALVFPTIAKLQAENYDKAAAQLLAGATVMEVNAELLRLNKAAIDAGFAPLDEHFVQVLTGKTPQETAAVYSATAKELRGAP